MRWWHRTHYLADAVPWRHYTGSSVLQNYDRSLSRIFHLEGPDLTGLSTAEIGAIALRLNNAFKAVPGHWSLHFDHIRARVRSCPRAVTTHAVLEAFDRGRAADLLEQPTFTNHDYLVIRRQPSVPGVSFLTNALMTRPALATADVWTTELKRFVQQTDHLGHLFGRIVAECTPLTADETARYCCAVATGEEAPVCMPSDATALNWRLCTQRFVGGWEPTLGAKHLAFASIALYPDESTSAMWEALYHLPMEGRHVTRWIAHQRHTTSGLFKRVQKRHDQDQESLFQTIGRVWGHQPTVTDTYEALMADDTNKARQEVSANVVIYGHFSPYWMTWSDPCRHTSPEVCAVAIRQAEERLGLVKDTLQDAGFRVILEGEGTKDAFLAMQPGDVRHGRRRHLLSSLNVGHASTAITASWRGPTHDAHLTPFMPQGHAAPPWFLATTQGSTLLRVVNHVKDVGHVGVPGPTGSGKSTFLDCTAASWLAHYHALLQARVFRMDIGKSGRVLNVCLGGRYDDLELRQPLYQPLRFIDQPEYFGWAYEWVMDICEAYKIEGLARIRSYVRTGLEALTQMRPEARTLKSYHEQLSRQSHVSQRGLSSLGAGSEMARAHQQGETNTVLNAQWAVRDAIEDLEKAQLLSASSDAWDESLIHTIEVGSLLRQRRLASAVLPYLAKRVRMTFTGEPVLYQVDEDALMLSLPKAEDEQEDDLRSLRKLNVSLMIATQSLTDILSSRVGALMIESCPTLFLLANPAAAGPEVAKIYAGLGCSPEEIRAIAEMDAQGDYYLRTTYRNQTRRRKFSMYLTGVPLALCGSSSEADHELLDKLLLRYPPGVNLAKAFFQAKGIDDDTIAQMGA